MNLSAVKRNAMLTLFYYCIKPVTPGKACFIALLLVTSKLGSRLPLAANLMDKHRALCRKSSQATVGHLACFPEL